MERCSLNRRDVWNCGNWTQKMGNARAALIKLALLSQNNDYPEDCMVQLDLNNTEPGYRCGRLLAVLERAQGRAIRNLNTTIVDRFYGTASSGSLMH